MGAPRFQKGMYMKIHRLSSAFLGLIAGASTMVAGGGHVTAAPRKACDVLSLIEVRSVVGAEMAVFEAGSSPVTTRGESTVSTCTYVTAGSGGRTANGPGAKFTLMWAPQVTLAQTSDFYVKRHIEATAMKGDTLVVAWVGSPSEGKTGNWSASQKLLAAVLQKL
jgi:hypothetical protein